MSIEMETDDEVASPPPPPPPPNRTRTSSKPLTARSQEIHTMNTALMVAETHLVNIGYVQTMEEELEESQAENRDLRDRVRVLEGALRNRYLIAVIQLINIERQSGFAGVDITDVMLQDVCNTDFSSVSYDDKIKIIPALTSLGYWVTQFDADDQNPISVDWDVGDSGVPFEWDLEHLASGDTRPYQTTPDGWLLRTHSGNIGVRFKRHGPLSPRPTTHDSS